MNSTFEKRRQEQETRLILHGKSGITCLDPERLEFCEAIRRTLLFHLVSGRMLEAAGSLDEVGRQLAPHGRFFRVHRACIVNLDYVQDISCRAVTMTCRAEIPIPKGKYDEIKDAFLAHVFRNGQVKR